MTKSAVIPNVYLAPRARLPIRAPLATIQERSRLPPDAAAVAARSPGAPPVGRSVDSPGALGGREPPRETWRSAAVLAETPRIYDADDHARVARRKVASASVLPSPLPDACRRARFRQAMRAYREEHGGVTVLGELASPGTLFVAARVATERTRGLRSQRSSTPKRCLGPARPRTAPRALCRERARAPQPSNRRIQRSTRLRSNPRREHGHVALAGSAYRIRAASSCTWTARCSSP